MLPWVRAGLLSALGVWGAAASAQNFSVSTLAGLPPFSGSADGTGASSRFDSPAAIAADGLGNLYVADTKNDTIRRIGANGAVTTLAGQAGVQGAADGNGAVARFSEPSGIAVDAAGNVFVADTDNCTIRKLTPDGTVTTLAGTALQSGSADGTGSAARFTFPWGVAVDGAGNVYVADWGNSAIRKITPTGVVTTLAGQSGASGSTDGIGANARFNFPMGVTVDSTGALYVADSGNDTVRKITPAGGVTTLAGSPGAPGATDGVGQASRFEAPHGIAIDAAGVLYIADSGNSLLRKLTPDGTVSTMAGAAGVSGYSDGSGSVARFAYMEGIALTPTGNLAIADTATNAIRVGTFGSSASLPQIQAQPTGGVVAPGQSVTLSVAAGGSNTYQWYLNGAPISGATSSSYVVAAAAPANSGLYSVAVSNGNGTVTSALADLTVGIVPTIVAAPADVTAQAGSTVSLSVTATNATNYTWTYNGAHIDGATSATLQIPNIGADQGGVYSVLVSNSQAAAPAVSATVTVAVDAHLVNLSTRALVGQGAGGLFAGFVISGPVAKRVLVRGIGPALTSFGVPGALSRPFLELFPSGASSPTASNAGWGGASAIALTSSQVGAFPLATGAADSAMVQSLAPGVYSAEVTGVDPTSGVALAEIYDADGTSPSSHLVNISSRAYVGTGSNVLSAGFVISGRTSETVLIRAVGPGLQPFGVTGTLANPELTVYNGSGQVVTSGIGWRGESRVASAFTAVGAFPLTNPADCALVLTLPPGSYSAVVSGLNQTTGVALVEVYDVP